MAGAKQNKSWQEVFGDRGEGGSGGQAETAQARYTTLKQQRDVYLTRARECGKLSLPALLPADSDTGGNKSSPDIKTPYQGIGAEGVNTLAARLLLALFPPNSPMFKMSLNDFEQETAAENADKNWKTEVDSALSKYEQAVQSFIESAGDRPAIHEAFLHLLVAGNVLLYDGEESPVRVFILPNYVVSRDPSGNAVEIIVLEEVSPAVLPADVKAAVETALADKSDSNNAPDKFWALYTHLKRVDQRWYGYQECESVVVDGTQSEYPLEGCPWIPLRMYSVAGEDYGRSYVENYLGDLKTLEALTQAVVECAALSAKCVFMVAPTGATQARDLMKAPNGGFVTGNADDVTVLRVDKSADLRVAFESSQIITQRLSKAFLLMDGTRRQAERVTAEEIRAVAAELEAGLGGIYSILSQEFQLPYVRRKLFKLGKNGKVPNLAQFESVEPTIVTGFEALGRGNDKTKLMGFMGAAVEAVGTEALQTYINVPNLLSRLAAADGINTTGLVRTAEEIMAEQQASQESEQANQLTQNLAPKAVDMIGKMATASPSPLQETTQEPPQEV